MEVREVVDPNVYYDDHGNERWTTTKLAKVIGVSTARVRQLVEAGRIEGTKSVAGRNTFPAWPRIQSRDLTWARNGKISDYMERWEERNGPVRDAETITGEG